MNKYTRTQQIEKFTYENLCNYLPTPVDEFLIKELCMQLIRDIPVDRLTTAFNVIKRNGFQDSITFEVSLNL